MNSKDMYRAHKMANGQKTYSVVEYPDNNQKHIANDGTPFYSPTCGWIVSVKQHPDIWTCNYGLFEVEFAIHDNGQMTTIKKIIGGRNLRFTA